MAGQSLETPDVARLLPVRKVEIVAGRGRSIVLSNVRCPVRRRTAAVEECAHCERGAGLARDALARAEWLSCRARACAGAAAERGGEPRVADAMTRSAVALRAGLSRSTAADALRARGQASAPVVDGEARPVGFVAEAELLRAPAGSRVADVMGRIAPSVQETALLSRAAALMAEHRLERIAVVSDDGVVVGALSALDVVCWAAASGAPPPAAQRG